ncbi:bifunctional 4-hydroxy-2-oxoglutarate aldolase/2-dehydro-3-deoxy-phosphogluconate aldolase [Nocardioides sp. Arc9.136]|uniref:bifunctional 4-hydroxy-2-oxoglutarate aldolase/2-dehydro-3-deoxy-phosphogluconate aldolase n=1 Tax=Nocardioides sp. Arc9.136 TaxID=2996826 RepID=UPI002666FB1A|nr:bifunctional 4-hydroxy-2-oxoglutarate aldolase/2-dehydro-3-deoxy-phosphogluconate aldolase [Nocardioides sp. Arc9.136]WKN48744.1 bifunctional 4-hydroxy-2-oxoglutarate aldolase/2-dehydro-3-deoxy-phosphogluconate aldolase [Nocardioides sp. Arc9.136]
MTGFRDLLARDRVLPVVTPASVDDALAAVDRLGATGTGTLEVALRTGVAEAALARAAGGPVLAGAGTVLVPEQVDRVVDAGAAFVVTPGFSAPVVERCLALGVPVLPGVATPGEVMAALSLGLDLVKLFPARELGGPAMVRALAGPFPGLRLVPSGGVTAASAAEYLALDAVLAVSGSWLLADAS